MDRLHGSGMFTLRGRGASRLLRLGVDHDPAGFPAFSHDGRFFACSATDGVVRLVEIEAVRQRLESLGFVWEGFPDEPAIDVREQ